MAKELISVFRGSRSLPASLIVALGFLAMVALACAVAAVVVGDLAGPVAAAKPTGGVAGVERLLASTDAATIKPGTSPAPNCYAPVLRTIGRLRAEHVAVPRRLQAKAMMHWARWLAYISRDWQLTAVRRARVRAKAIALLMRATRADPHYVPAWVELAFETAIPNHGAWPQAEQKEYFHAMAMALLAGPHDPLAQLPRINYLFGTSEHWSPAQRRAFCYRALLYLKFRNHAEVARFFLYGLFGYKTWLNMELKKFCPKQLAASRAGTWKPDPSADPWPPPEKKAAKAAAATRPAH